MPNLSERLHRPPGSVHHRAEQGEAAREKVKSDSTKCSCLLTSPSLSLPFPLYHSLPPLPLALCLSLESPVGNVNRDFTAQCRRISGAHISPTCDLHQRRGSWGIFHASEGGSGDGVAG